MNKDVFVYADWVGLDEPTLLGTLNSEQIRQHDVFRFSYANSWLNHQSRLAIDPKLELFTGVQYKEDSKNFGIFLDSCPDRWGRLLMQRREAVYAKQEDRKEKRLTEIDFLLGVHDQSRMGGLRFKTTLDGDFLNNDSQQAAPPLTSLKDLAYAANIIEQDTNILSPDYIKWLSLLISPGSSLGGARPKASVVDEQNQLWIAKFPSKYDQNNTGAWEYLTYQLACDAGITMSASRIEKINSRHHTFLTKRFDRSDKGNRKHFCSAMTLLEYNDGDVGQSYLELAAFLSERGANSKADLAQLFRRIIFNIAVSNIDDHLRNHGFLYQNNGWILSPAYDINPTNSAQGLHLNISEIDNQLSYELALETAKYYRLTQDSALGIVNEVKAAVCHWREKAQAIGINRAEQQRMQTAFNV
jgi:serine/threonine-protein kinase HipA